MTDLHPMIPSDKQLQHWIDRITYPHNEGVGPSIQDRKLAILAYQAGADAELEACCEWLNKSHYGATLAANFVIEKLRVARRPKPPSKAESALNALEHILRHSQTDHGANTIRLALEHLKKLEEATND